MFDLVDPQAQLALAHQPGHGEDAPQEQVLAEAVRSPSPDVWVAAAMLAPVSRLPLLHRRQPARREQHANQHAGYSRITRETKN